MDNLALLEDSDLVTAPPYPRSKFACLTCRVRKVRCDEAHPECGSCTSGRRECIWQDDSPRPNVAKSRGSKACESCRIKKLRCSGPQANGSCERCHNTHTECTWLERKRPRRRSGRSMSPGPVRRVQYTVQPDYMPDLRGPGEGTDYVSMAFDTLNNTWPGGMDGMNGLNGLAPGLGGIGNGFASGVDMNMGLGTGGSTWDVGEDEKLDLINLYFSTVHNMEYLSFIPSHQFMDMHNAGTVPQELLMVMLASALRLGADATSDSLARADGWVDEATRLLLARMYKHYTPVDLMAVLLACNYDSARGNLASAQLLSANAARMMRSMSLHQFDTAYPAGVISKTSPIVTNESLRRAAWATFYLDTVVDPAHSFHAVREEMMELQLPGDEQSFLTGINATTGPLIPSSGSTDHLDLSAHLLRATAARRRLSAIVYTLANSSQPQPEIQAALAAAENDVKGVLAGLPSRCSNVEENRDRLAMFVHLHALRAHLKIILARGKALLEDGNVQQLRQERVKDASSVADSVSRAQGLQAKLGLQTGVIAFVALEILIVDGSRLDTTPPTTAISTLLACLRDLSKRTTIGYILYIEACQKIVRHAKDTVLSQEDWESFQKEYQYTGNPEMTPAPGEFNWIKIDPSHHSIPPSQNTAAVALLDLNNTPTIDPALDNMIDPALSGDMGGTTLADAEQSNNGQGLAFDLDSSPWGERKAGQGLEEMYVGVFREGKGKGAAGAAWGLCD